MLLAQDCFLCGGVSGDELLCTGCRDDLPLLQEACPQCALPSPRGEICGACLSKPPRFDRTVAVWRYDPPCDRLIHALKYRARLPLAALAARAPDPVDLVVPMPLHRRRLAERGFNHAVEIARPLSRQLQVPLAPSGVARLRHTAPQMRLPYPERSANVRGAFGCELDLRGLRVAVIDDVMTTGATLNELAQVLKRAGAVRVENWIVARTLLD